MIRLFAALGVPDDIADGLVRCQHGLEGARWRPRESFHLTLRFFGDLDERVAEDLDGLLCGLRGRPVEVVLNGAGAFALEDGRAALYARAEASEPLARLAAKCETLARKAGLRPEGRAFRPHVTLAYLKGGAGPEAAAWIQAHNLLQSPPWTADRVRLYSSRLGRDGSAYQVEREYPLA